MASLAHKLFSHKIWSMYHSSFINQQPPYEYPAPVTSQLNLQFHHSKSPVLTCDPVANIMQYAATIEFSQPITIQLTIDKIKYPEHESTILLGFGDCGKQMYNYHVMYNVRTGEKQVDKKIESYGKPLKNGDTVKVILDAYKNISFVVNNEKVGVAANYSIHYYAPLVITQANATCVVTIKTA